MKSVRKTVVLVLSALMALLLVMGTGATKAKAADKSLLRAAMQGEPQVIRSFDGMTYGGTIADMFYDGLIYWNSQTDEYLPCLATSWETIDPCTMRYHLRDDVFTKNGTQFTAKDVVYTFKLGQENGVSGVDFAYYDVDNFEIIDDFTIDIKTFEPFANAFIYLAQTTFYMHIEEDLEAAGGVDALMTDAPDAYGRYLLKEWVPGDHITAIRNDNYFGEKGYFDEIEVSFIPDDTARYFAVQAGDVDVITYATTSQAAEVANIPELQLFEQTGASMQVMAFNCAEGKLFNNETLRKAVVTAINKDAITQVFTEGYGSPVQIFLPNGSSLFQEIDPALCSPYDPEAAKALLAEAGYPDGFEFTLVLPGSFQKIAEVVQANLADIGVTMNIDAREMASWNESLRAGDFDAIIVQYSPGNNLQPFYLMDGRVPYTSKGPCQLKSDEWNDLLDQLYAESDIEAALPISKQLTEIFAEHVPAACLVSKNFLFIGDASLTGFYTATKCDMLNFDEMSIAE